MQKKNKPDETANTVGTIAAWMLAKLKEQGGVLQQDDAAMGIADRFGKSFVYENENSGNTCIDRGVLGAFRELTGDTVVWIKGERLWRLRESGDDPTRQQT